LQEEDGFSDVGEDDDATGDIGGLVDFVSVLPVCHIE
jgi:hypothetical protein